MAKIETCFYLLTNDQTRTRHNLSLTLLMPIYVLLLQSYLHIIISKIIDNLSKLIYNLIYISFNILVNWYLYNLFVFFF